MYALNNKVSNFMKNKLKQTEIIKISTAIVIAMITCYRLNACVPLNFIFWNHIPNVMVWRYGLWEVIRSWEQSSMNGMSTLIGNHRELSHSFHCVKTKQDGHLWTMKWVLQKETKRNHFCWCFDLGLLKPQNVRNKFLLFRRSTVFCYSSSNGIRHHLYLSNWQKIRGKSQNKKISEALSHINLQLKF